MIRGIITFLAAGLVPLAALAQMGAPTGSEQPETEATGTAGEAEPAAETAGEATDVAPEPTPAASIPDTYAGRLTRGHRAYIAGDPSGAIDAYNKAKEMEPGRAEVYYFIGCAQAKLGMYDEAVSSLGTAGTIAGDKDEPLHAKTLFMVAVVAEMKGDFASAKAAWEAYLGYAQTHGEATTFAATAQARLEAIEKKLALDESYKVVVERIASGS